MRAYIIGLGSIGSRHSRILNDFGFEVIGISDSKKSIKDIKYYNAIREIISIKDISPKKNDILVISSITSLHTKYAKLVKHSGARIFCEKPGPILNSDKIKILFNLRYLPFIQFIKNISNKIEYIKLEFLANAKKWHPSEDWKRSYVFRHNLGGGSFLTNSHEVDLISFLGFKKNKYILKKRYKYIDIDNQKLDTSFTLKNTSNNVNISSSIITNLERRKYEFKNRHNSFIYDFQKYKKSSSTSSLSDIDMTYYLMWEENLKNNGTRLPTATDNIWIHELNKLN